MDYINNNNGGYEIRQYVQIPSPVSLVTQSPLYKSNQEFEDDIFKDKSGFVKRC